MFSCEIHPDAGLVHLYESYFSFLTIIIFDFGLCPIGLFYWRTKEPPSQTWPIAKRVSDFLNEKELCEAVQKR